MTDMTFGCISFVSAEEFPDLKEKTLYRVYDYRSGDCVLSANTYMLKRKAILLEDSNYKKIKNNTKPEELNGGRGSVRKAACHDTDGHYNNVNVRYSFKKGTKYTVRTGTLPGTKKGNTKRIKALIQEHPEGVVVWGPSCSPYGAHAVLASRITKNGNLRYIDSAHNTWTNSPEYGGRNARMNVGEESIEKTIVYGVKYFTIYWYIKEIE